MDKETREEFDSLMTAYFPAYAALRDIDLEHNEIGEIFHKYVWKIDEARGFVETQEDHQFGKKQLATVLLAFREFYEEQHPEKQYLRNN